MGMNFLDRFKSYTSSTAAVQIAKNRALQAQYEAVSGFKSKTRSTLKPNDLMKHAQKPLAQGARYYEENFGIVTAMLDEMCKNVVGDGININPRPKLLNGKPATELAEQLSVMYEAHSRLYCMDGRTQRFEAERMILRSYIRDGEVFIRQYVHGGHDFLTEVNYAVEPFECDHIDAGLTDPSNNVQNGFALGKYNRVTGYYYNADPTKFSLTPVFIPASDIFQLANKTRLNSLRGVSKLAPVLNDIEDLASFKEATQLALKAAARITLVHEVSNPASPVESLGEDEDDYPELEFGYSNVTQVKKGDNVKVMESAKGIGDTVAAILAMQRQITSGVGVSHSSTTSNYEKSYSAQRQELIDRWAGYMVLRAMLVNYCCRPTYEGFVNAAFIQGRLKLPAGLDITSLYDAEFSGAVLPWIDPKKEAESIKMLMSSGMLPLSLALAQRGYDLRPILTRYKEDRELQRELEVDDLNFLEHIMTNSTGGNNAKTKQDQED
ncbi:phage portal protein [Vibrio diazotrophicus]|uniref:Phage portal protein n=1 Tax=Vibrio diazotrophicus TaxID=685 RepID=A0A2J8HSB7_VIBDI|nr:phage portal protein [Vibrio diazotrophicus]PNI01177.1 phage portal protein [Vibrio diazotrophicus]